MCMEIWVYVQVHMHFVRNRAGFLQISRDPPMSLKGPAGSASLPFTGLHSHIPSSGPWFAVVPGISPVRSESPCPRTVTGVGDGEQVVSQEMGASSAEWEGR